LVAHDLRPLTFNPFNKAPGQGHGMCHNSRLPKIRCACWKWKVLPKTKSRKSNNL